MQMDMELAMRILGLTKEEVNDSEKVKSAYRTIVKAIHPDTHTKDQGRFDSLMGLVSEAHTFINNGGANNGAFDDPMRWAQQRPAWAPGQGQAGPGAYRPSGFTRPKSKLFITFDDLKKLYNSFTGQIATKTEDGNNVMVNLHDLKKYDTILKDKIAFVLSKNGTGTPQQFEIRKTRGSTDTYIMDITCRVPENVEFPLKFRLSYPMNYEATIDSIGKWEINCDINKVGFRLILRLNVIHE